MSNGTGPVRFVLVTDTPSTSSRVSYLASCSPQVDLLGTTAFTTRGLRKIARRPPRIVLIDGQGHEATYLSFARNLLAVAPSICLVLFGRGQDISSVARAIAAGFRGSIPLGCDALAFQSALSACVLGEVPSVDMGFARVWNSIAPEAPHRKPRSPNTPQESGSRRASRRLIRRCLAAGLTISETAYYLGIGDDTVTRVAVSTVSRGVPWFAVGRAALAVTSVGLCALVLIGGMRWLKARTEHVAFSGRLTYDDEAPLPVESFEVLFHCDTEGDGLVRRVGRSYGPHPDGTFDGVMYREQTPGLSRGVYRVTICLPGQTPLPAFIADATYGVAEKSPLTAWVTGDPIVLRVPRPKDQLTRFDANNDGTLDPDEKAAVRAALADEHIASAACD